MDWSLSRSIDRENRHKKSLSAESSFIEDQKIRIGFRKYFEKLSLIDTWSEDVKVSMLEQHKRISKIQNGPEF